MNKAFNEAQAMAYNKAANVAYSRGWDITGDMIRALIIEEAKPMTDAEILEAINLSSVNSLIRKIVTAVEKHHGIVK